MLRPARCVLILSLSRSEHQSLWNIAPGRSKQLTSVVALLCHSTHIGRQGDDVVGEPKIAWLVASP